MTRGHEEFPTAGTCGGVLLMVEMSNTATGTLPQVVIVTEAMVRAEATEEPAGGAEMVGVPP